MIFVRKKADEPKPALAEKPDPLAVERVRAADIETDIKRRLDLAQRFSVQAPTFERDLDGINPRFLRWIAGQSDEVLDDLKAYWEGEAIKHDQISHAHERGQHARMTMVIQYAAEKYGYEITEGAAWEF